MRMVPSAARSPSLQAQEPVSGSATALAFAHEGANVVVADVSQQGNQETARLIEHAGVQASQSPATCRGLGR